MALSAFTHLWNPIGFPSLYIDEGIYMGRAMHVLEGHGPQESTIVFPFDYDHPYFGQLFLAGALSIIGYPDLLNLTSPSRPPPPSPPKPPTWCENMCESCSRGYGGNFCILCAAYHIFD